MSGAPRPTSDMNITPMIDVLLVLLVIFMAALPLSQRGLDVVLPGETAPPARPFVGDARIVVEVDAQRRVSLNRQPIPLADLGERLRLVYETRRDKTLFVMGAPTLRYGDIVDVIDSAKGAGVQKVGIVTESMRRVSTGADSRPGPGGVPN